MATLHLKKTNLAKILPPLIEGYNLAINNNLMSAKINTKHLALIQDLANSDPETTDSIKYLEDIITFCQELKTKHPAKPITKYLKPFLDNSIQFTNSNDFSTTIAPIFLTSLIENCIENALLSIQQAKKGEIKIWTSKNSKYTILNIKDTGLGMSAQATKEFFERYLRKTKNQNTPGLGLCRMALRYQGGDIICHSKLGEFTLVEICFVT